MHCITNQLKTITCEIALPSSKSIINRLLVIQHLSHFENYTGLISGSGDIETMQLLLNKIKNSNYPGGDPDAITEINVGNAGTVMRFLTAVLAVTPGKWKITGSERMQQRPVKPLTDALLTLGAEITFEKTDGYPPILITGNSELKGGVVKLNSGISSQFISALMMLGPVLKNGILIEMQGNIISGSYIRMTQALMQKTAAEVSLNGKLVTVKEGKYSRVDFDSLVEPDWSAAAFWFQVAAFAPETNILLKGLHRESIQGDSVLPEIYSNLGVKSAFSLNGLLLTKSEKPACSEFDYDFSDCPDLAQPVIVTCAALRIKGRFSGLKSLRIKETDRIEALKVELQKLGYGIEVEEDQIVLNGEVVKLQKDQVPVVVNCHDDHRMAMSFAPLALLNNKICLDDADVVKKSYPGFWKDFQLAGFELSTKL